MLVDTSGITDHAGEEEVVAEAVQSDVADIMDDQADTNEDDDEEDDDTSHVCKVRHEYICIY